MSVPTPDASGLPLPNRPASHSRIAPCLFAMVLLGTLARSCGRWHWTLELTTHFTVQAAVLSLIAGALLLLWRHKWLGGLCIGLAIYNADAWILSWLPDNSGAPSEVNAASLRVVSANVYSRNRNVKELRDWLDSIQPDVIFISEVDPWWAMQFEGWKADWPHQIVRPRGDHFGLALLSRFPIRDSEVRFLERDIPAIQARIAGPAGEVTVVGLHTLPPVGSLRSAIRNRQLAESAAWISELPKPRIVVGDLNCAPASPYFGDFLKATGLRDSRRGWGWQATWNASRPLLRIPIDHCLVELEMRVLNREVGPDIGSDHFPIWARIGTSRPPAEGR